MSDTFKSFDGAYERFSPAVLVPQQAMPNFQRSDDQHPSPPVNVIFSKDRQNFVLQSRGQNNGELSPRLVRLTSPNDAVFTTNTLPNNIKADSIQKNAGSQRCYMTLNPDLYEVECPYGQLKYAGWNLMRTRQRTDGCTAQNDVSVVEPILGKSSSQDMLREPTASSSSNKSDQQPVDQDFLAVKPEPKRCRFNPMPPNIINIDGSSSHINISHHTGGTFYIDVHTYINTKMDEYSSGEQKNCHYVVKHVCNRK